MLSLSAGSAGVFAILLPREIVVERPMMGYGPSMFEYVTAEGVRIYGCVAVASGILFGGLPIWLSVIAVVTCGCPTEAIR